MHAVHSQVYVIKDMWYLGRQMSHLSVHTKLGSLFKLALLYSKTSTASKYSFEE
jgi:hypothetical protein